MGKTEVLIEASRKADTKLIQKRINAALKKKKGFPALRWKDSDRERIEKCKKDWRSSKLIEKEVATQLKPFSHLYTAKYDIGWITTKRGDMMASAMHARPEVFLRLSHKNVTIKAQRYTAVCGETLEAISMKTYGTDAYAKDILKANKEFKKCKVKNFVIAKEVLIPQQNVPAAILTKRNVSPSKSQFKLEITDQLPSYSTTVKKVPLGPTFLVTPLYVVKFSGEAALDIEGKPKNSRIPVDFGVGKDGTKYSQTLSKIDFGFSMTNWSVTTFECRTSISTKAFKLSAKFSAMGAIEVGVSSVPIKFSKNGWDFSGTMSISGKVVIIPKPPKNVPVPWYSRLTDFVADHALEGALVVGAVIAAPVVLSGTTIIVVGGGTTAALAL